MTNIFMILTGVSMLAVLASLVAGVIVMARGGEANKKYANKLMQARVILQGVALLFFALTILSRAS